MKTKNTMTKYFSCKYNELDSFAELLEKQAAAGWALKDISGMSCGFRRCAPRKVKYNVEMVYPDGSDRERAEFAKFCESTGWKRIFDGKTVQVFENENLDAEPIHTDTEVKLKAIHQECKWNSVILPIIAVFLGTFFWMIQAYNMDYREYLSNRYLLIVYGLPFILLLLAGEAVNYLVWYKKARKAADRGDEPVYRKTRFSRGFELACIICLFMILWGQLFLDLYYSGSTALMLFGILAFAAMVVFYVGTKLYDAAHNETGKITISARQLLAGLLLCLCIIGVGSVVFSAYDGEELTLTLDDLGIKASGEINRMGYKSGTYMLQREYGTDDSKNEKGYRLYYEVHRARTQDIFNLVMERRYAHLKKKRSVMQSLMQTKSTLTIIRCCSRGY